MKGWWFLVEVGKKEALVFGAEVLSHSVTHQAFYLLSKLGNMMTWVLVFIQGIVYNI